MLAQIQLTPEFLAVINESKGGRKRRERGRERYKRKGNRQGDDKEVIEEEETDKRMTRGR